MYAHSGAHVASAGSTNKLPNCNNDRFAAYIQLFFTVPLTMMLEVISEKSNTYLVDHLGLPGVDHLSDIFLHTIS